MLVTSKWFQGGLVAALLLGCSGVRSLQQEEEDLPAFVYDRVKAGTLIAREPSVTIKRETPVTYFDSDEPLTVTVNVSFPKGVVTQSYPGVSRFAPAIAAPSAVAFVLNVDSKHGAFHEHYAGIARGCEADRYPHRAWLEPPGGTTRPRRSVSA